MSTDQLHAYLEGKHLGVFTQSAEGISFGYDKDTPVSTPLSLSLPPNTEHKKGAAEAFLDNLLPDRDSVRKRWARERQLGDTSPFTLLGAYGEDVAGAVVLSDDANLQTREPALLVEATEEDIATRIATLAHEDTSWLDPRVKPRMSVAGAQPKFTLAQVEESWFWPTFELPSTHILKPPSRKLRKVEEFETATLEFARHIGLSSSRSQVTTFLGERTFVTRRWDRAGDLRLHAEDLNQSLGNNTNDKYQVPAVQVARFLAQHGQAYEFVRQLVFNVAVGNADAHAKNYSVLLSGNQVRLAPLYDSLPTYLYPQFDATLAMPIDGARFPREVIDRRWSNFARESGLDVERVRSIAYEITSGIRDDYEEFFAPFFGTDTSRMKQIVTHVRGLQKALLTMTDG